ncbi:hypothetical protein OG21DRAFT_892944 [Imleria badia]|nr:hypothetical protein OG21DRAFT_892944 [Imleria badia]
MGCRILRGSSTYSWVRRSLPIQVCLALIVSVASTGTTNPVPHNVSPWHVTFPTLVASFLGTGMVSTLAWSTACAKPWFPRRRGFGSVRPGHASTHSSNTSGRTHPRDCRHDSETREIVMDDVGEVDVERGFAGLVEASCLCWGALSGVNTVCGDG